MSLDLVIGGRYEIIEEIGKGGMAVVYKAKCQVLNRYVALKVLRPEFRGDADFVEKFKIEAQNAGGLSHPNIVSIYDVCQEEDLNFIVMEYVEGITLKQYIANQGVLGWKEAVDYAAQICAGLEHAHKKGIVHRDIKPQNIIITREGTAKITDFGIAKATNEATIEMGASNMGSVHYFSPEQARGGFVDCKSDIYSLGVILYEMVTGKVPFDGDNLVTIAMQHLENAPTAPTKVNPDIPESLEIIIGRAMCKEKTGRYDDVTKMLIDLKKVYIGTSVSLTEKEVSDDTLFFSPILDSRKPKKTQSSDEKQKRFEREIIIGTPKKDINKKKQKELNSKGDRISIIAGIVSGLLLVTLFAFAFRYIFLGSGIGDIELPDLSGKTVAEANEMIKETKLTIEVSGEEKNDNFDVGEIISQEPEAKKMVKENAKIKVKVSLGGEDTKMPQLSTMSEEDAKKLLNSLNINYSVTQEESEDVPEGYVIRQYPSSGTSMKKSDTATIYVSKGQSIKTAKVPSLIGMTESASKSMLENLNLVLGNVYYQESTKPEGTVAKQSLPADTEVKEGTTVDIIISKGKSSATSPDPNENANGGENAGGNTNEEDKTPSIRPVPNTLE